MGIGEVQREYNLSVADAFEKIAWDSVKELMPLLESKYEELFHRAVWEFYGDYSPEIYTRNYSLYDVVEINVDVEGMTISYSGAPENATPFRKGGGTVFELSFMGGYHGGAASGDYTVMPQSDPDDSGFTVRHTPHPSPGTPYWRTPHPWYTDWGRPAEWSIPPADVFMESKEEFLNRELALMFKKILYENLGI